MYHIVSFVLLPICMHIVGIGTEYCRQFVDVNSDISGKIYFSGKEMSNISNFPIGINTFVSGMNFKVYLYI